MIETIKRDFFRGLKNLKFWASVFSERVKIEINALKLIAQISKLDEKKDALLKKIGKEIYDDWGTLTEINENEKFMNLVKQIKNLENEIEDKKTKLAELEDMSKWKL